MPDEVRASDVLELRNAISASGHCLATVHCPTLSRILDRLEAAEALASLIDSERADAAKQENEACAKIAERTNTYDEPAGASAAYEIACDIRKRLAPAPTKEEEHAG